MARNDQSRHVNSMLNTLRGEHFRHIQNIRGSRSHVSSRNTTIPRSFPAGLVGLPYAEDNAEEKIEEDTQSASRKCSGPSPPKSWSLNTLEDVHNTARWRAEALSLIFQHLPFPFLPATVPRLTLLCLRRILSTFTASEFSTELVPFIPHHLRRELLRHTAIHSPLSTLRLESLLGEEGFIAGELIVVGPAGSFGDTLHMPTSPHPVQTSEEWDMDEWQPDPLHTIIAMSTHVSTSLFLSFPATLTHIALINLPSALPLHRLPPLCPLVVVLDLSYNSWLKTSNSDKILERVEWSRWGQLEVLGFRECRIPEDFPLRVNKGRWDDVSIVR